MLLCEVSVGAVFGYGGREWILLDRREDRHLCISRAGVGSRPYDGGLEARFDRAEVGRYLNGAYYEALLAGAGADEAFPWKEGDVRERRYLFYRVKTMEHMEEFLQRDHARESESLEPTGVTYDYGK